MKKQLFIFFLLPLIGLSQDYITMLDEDNEWNIMWYSDVGDQPTYSSFLVSGTELINNRTYQIVWLHGEESECRWREDNGKVYRLNNDLTETKIIDFTFEVGDRLDVGQYIGSPCPADYDYYINNVRVIDISYQIIGGEMRKVLSVQAYYNNSPQTNFSETWIEGIGSTRTIFAGGYGHLELRPFLACFTRNGETSFFNNADECETPLEIPSYPKEQFTLYPNPVTNTSILQLPSEASVDHIKIYNLGGKGIRDEDVTKEYVTINAMDYASGLYFYQSFQKINC
jgi:hypothetical protein